MATTEVDVGEAVEFYLGEARTITWVVKDSSGTPLDCTGRDFKWQLRLSKYHPNALLTKVTTGGSPKVVVDADQIGNKGKVHVNFDTADTIGRSAAPTNLYAGTYSYGLAQTNVAFDVEASGDFVILGTAVAP